MESRTQSSCGCEKHPAPLITVLGRLFRDGAASALTILKERSAAFCGCLGFQCDVETELGQALDQTVSGFVTVDDIEEISTQVFVVPFMLQHVVGRDENAVGDGHQSSFLTSPRRDAAKLGRKISVFHVRGGPGDLTHRPPQPNVTFTHLAAEPLPGAFIVAGT